MKRHQKPQPKRGQWQWSLFTELYGKEWSHYDALEIDHEQKITEFDYEKFLPNGFLDTVNKDDDDFKTFIKKLNFNSRTEYERHQENKKEFT